jgi:hypothetical protein
MVVTELWFSFFALRMAKLTKPSSFGRITLFQLLDHRLPSL